MTRPRWRGGWWSAARACPSPNFGPRPAGTPVTLAIVHSISLPPGEYGGDAIERLFTNRLDPDAHPSFAGLRGLEVSAHFLVRRDGALLQFVACDERAWHAGRSVWRGRENCNDWSIGIELEGLEGLGFEAAQYAALARLLRALARASRSTRWLATSTWRPAERPIPARASTGCGCAARCVAAGRGCPSPTRPGLESMRPNRVPCPPGQRLARAHRMKSRAAWRAARRPATPSGKVPS